MLGPPIMSGTTTGDATSRKEAGSVAVTLVALFRRPDGGDLVLTNRMVFDDRAAADAAMASEPVTDENAA